MHGGPDNGGGDQETEAYPVGLFSKSSLIMVGDALTKSLDINPD